MSGEQDDWISSYLELTEGLPTPPVFRLWSAIFTIGAVLERRAWLITAFGVLYPNLFTLLIGPPGAGKTVAMTPAKKLCAKSKAVILAPDDMTKAAFLDEMAEHSRRILHKGETMLYHPMTVMISELGTLVNAHDLEFFSLLSDVFDNKDEHRSRRRGHNSGKAISLANPSLSILAGTQPGFLGDLLPEGAWQQGFTSRLLMIYASGAPECDMFAQLDDRSQLFAELSQALVHRSKLVGVFKIDEEAKDFLRLWTSAGMKPVPDHERLAHYRTRRGQHVLKLAMIAAVSARNELTITQQDCERAKSWLLAAESMMPQIFRDMKNKSDGLLLNELWRCAWELWVQSAVRIADRKPVHHSKLMHFLHDKCPVDRAQRMIEMACSMHWLEQVPDTLLFTPKPRGATGAER